MGSHDNTRNKLGWRAGLAAGVLLLLAVLLVLVNWLGALLPLAPGKSDMEWAREVERENSTGHESAEAVVATANGFSVVGHTNSRQPGIQQAWVLQFDRAPPPRWERTYGKKKPGTGTLGRAIASLPGGGLIVAGEEQVAVGRFQGWLLALSPEGDVLWEQTPGHGVMNGLNAVSVLEDGSIVAGGDQDGVGWVVRMDPRGQQLWEASLPQLEHVTALVSLPAQRVAVLGTAETATVGLGSSRLFLLESDGRATGEKRLPIEGRGELDALALLGDGGLVATGRWSRPDSTDWSFWVVRMDSRGETLWEHVSEGTQMEAGHDVTAFPDGSIVVVGSSWREPLTDQDAKVWRFSADGSLLWQQTYGGAENDVADGIARLADESLVVVGTTLSQGAGKTDLWTIGLTPDGQLLWEETFGAP